MDQELKEFLQGMESRMIERIDRVEKRIDAVETRIGGVETRIDAVETRIMERVDGRIDAVEARIKDFIREADRDLETRLIGEFWKWGRTSEVRTRQALTDTGLLNERLLAVEDRITALERGRA